nr:hypothetical protein [Streptomyces chartreusis]
MITFPHRRKGGAPELGASTPGDVGPFGQRPHRNDDQDQDQVPADGEGPRGTSAAG